MLFLSCWPIRRKLIVGGAALCLIVLILAGSGIRSMYAYRNLVRSIRDRAAELPLAAELAGHVVELRITASRMRYLREFSMNAGADNFEKKLRRQEFQNQLLQLRGSLQQYRNQLIRDGDADTPIDDKQREWVTVRKMELALQRIQTIAANDQDWLFNEIGLISLNEELDDLHQLAKELPSHLHMRLHALAGDVRTEYRALIFASWITLVAAAGLLGLLGWFFSISIFQPLRRLLHDARRIEAGDFQHRVCITTRDEIAELAAGMNAMTDRFQEINLRLEEKVDERTRELKERTQELIQSEQLASVGFLAAGVAHEINNPLQAIAGYSEALEMRVDEVPTDANSNAVDFDWPFLRRSLNRIHDAAIRCKGITDKLLDFSRMGKAEKHATDLRELTLDVIDMVRSLGKYKGKRIEFQAEAEVVASVNAQEMKQVVLNLLTNAMESLNDDGVVQVQLRRDHNTAELVVSDNGCGMTPEVLQHLFKPFFTKRREGAGQGTGLGLSITHRILADHHGAIQAFSEGPGKGSRMRITLPLKNHEEQHESRQQQAA